MVSETKEIYEFGPFSLDVGQHRFNRSDGITSSSLPEKAFQTLVFLVRNQGRLVTKNELLDAVWPFTAVEENSLNKSIHAVRHALGEEPREQKYIETVHKHGYRFIATARRVDSVDSPTVAQNGAAATKPDSSDQAYDLYVRGKVKVASENREDTEAAIKVLEETVAIDPNFAEAFAQLARAYNTMAFKYASDLERKRFAENAEVAIEKALALNPDLAEGHFARGLILWSSTKRFPHEQAIQSYKRSLALNPNSYETHHQLSLVYSHIGLWEDAERSVKKALEINPNNTLARFRKGVYYAYQGKFDDAIAVYTTIPRDVTPLLVDRSIAEALVQTGRLSEAEALVDDYLRKCPQDEGGSFTSVKALLLAHAGKRKEAEETILKALGIGKGFGHFHHTTYNAASTYAVLDEPEEAVRWLEMTAESGFPNYTYFLNDPNLSNIRDHQRFHDFMARQKLQWERFKSLVRN